MSQISNQLNETTLKALFLSAFHLYLDSQSDDFYGSETDVDMGNRAGELTSKALGVNIAEDDDWQRKLYKATPSEIDQAFITELLAVNKDKLPEGEKLFTVGLENPFIMDTWQETEDNVLHIDLWTENNIGIDSGWDKEEADELEALNPGEGLITFGDFAHTIIRIR